MSTALETLIAAMSIEDLARASGRSVTELVAFAMGGKPEANKPKIAVVEPEERPKTKVKGTAKKAKGASQKAQSTSQKAKGAEVDTRTPAGRAAYQEAVFGVLTEEPMLAQDIRAKVGGTPAQCRAALNRLIYEDKVTFDGQARSTTYSRV